MKQRSQSFVDEEVYPVTASALPTNAHHIHACPILGQSQPYAACLKRITDYEAGQIQEAYSECRRAIGGPACTAWSMREEETKAGKAIYYVNRAKLQAFNGVLIATDRPGKAPAVITNDFWADRPTPEPSKTAAKPVAALGGSYADAINATMKTLSSPAPGSQNTNKPAMNPGETPLEYVRRIKAMNA